MKITEIKVIVASPGRNFVTVKIMTDQGLYGIGDATVNGREKAVVAYLQDHVIPILIGRDPARIEDIWQYLYKGAYWRRGPITMAAISGIDIALWDIKAKAANMPLYQLLGGASRDKVMIYQHVGGMTIEETVEGVIALREKGLQAIRAQVSIPGLPPIYGTGPNTDQAAGGMVQARPVEEVWATHKYLPLVPKLFQALRDAVGWDVHLLHDTHHRLTPIEAARLGKRSGTLPPVLAGRPGARRTAGRLSPDPPAHHHAHCAGRGVQHDLGLPAADLRTADRLYPRHLGPCRRGHRPQAHL